MSAIPDLGCARRVSGTAHTNAFDAWRLDVAAPLAADELLLAVERLNLDATSFRDLAERAGDEPLGIAGLLVSIVAERGKLHNPRTDSGGVLCGQVVRLGADRLGEVAPGTRVVTLVSNTLVPLRLEAVGAVDAVNHQVTVSGEAILPPFARYAAFPPDLDERLALVVFDVCGVVPPVARQARDCARMLVVGAAGRAGLLALAASVDAIGPGGEVVAAVQTPAQAAVVDQLGWPNVIARVVDATDPRSLRAAVGERLADAVVDCTSARGTEVACVAACRSGGQVHFFNMATSFQAATLGAELVGRAVGLGIGFGLYPEAPDAALALVRRYPRLRAALVSLVNGACPGAATV